MTESATSTYEFRDPTEDLKKKKIELEVRMLQLEVWEKEKSLDVHHCEHTTEVLPNEKQGEVKEISEITGESTNETASLSITEEATTSEPTPADSEDAKKSPEGKVLINQEGSVIMVQK